MPSYTGTGKTRTYLRERALQHAAQDNKKITSFFAPAANSHITLPTRTTPTEHDLDIELPKKAVTLSSDSSHMSEDESTPFLEHKTPESTPADTAMSVPSNTSNKFHCLLLTHTANGLEPLPTSFLDMTTDEDDTSNLEPVLDMIKTLIMSAKKFKSFTSLFYLNSLKQFIELFEKYQKNPRIKAPMCKESRTMAVSIGKGPYMVWKIHTLYRYVSQFQTLPPISKGKHHTFPSLLNNKRIAPAVRQYLTVLANGEVSEHVRSKFILLWWKTYQITPLLLMKQVNNVIIQSLGLDAGGQCISEPTAHRWLAKLGYELKDVKKVYMLMGMDERILSHTVKNSCNSFWRMRGIILIDSD